MKQLIINADDFGYSPLFNKMILELLAKGYVTSTSVMIESITDNQKSQVEELKKYEKNDLISIGLHIDFKTVDFDIEIKRQFNYFVEIMGFEPHHLDIHKMDHLLDGGYTAIQKFAQAKKIPCKNLSCYGNNVMDKNTITTPDSVYAASKKSFEEIKEWLSSLNEGIHSINFHPGYYDPESKSSLNREREDDANKISKIIGILSEYEIKLASFKNIS